MEIIDSIRTEMTSNSINKIMRTNLNLNSKILAKNTTEILNNCIGKLYKQMPTTFKKDLHQGKLIVTPKSDNHAPIERLIMQKRHTYRPVDGKSSIYEGQMSNGLMSLDQKKPTGKLSKKLSKSPGYKIYNSKRYCSSNSSSSGSIWQRYDDRNRLFRAYHTQSNYGSSKQMVQKSPREPLNSFSNLVPPRNQYMCPSLATWRRAVEVSSNIQKDLMSVDEAIKNRLNVAAIKASKAMTEQPNNIMNMSLLKMPTLSSSNTKLKSKYFKRPLKMKEKIMDSISMASSQRQKPIKTPKKEHLVDSPLVKLPMPMPAKKNLNTTTVSQINSPKIGENEIKSNINKTQSVVSRKRRTTLRNCVPPEEEALMKMETYQNYKLSNGKTTTPSATYCIANPSNIKHTKYVT